MTIRLILNGKAAGEPDLREAVESLRHGGVRLEVRVTWEGGDAIRFIEEAHRDGIERIIIGGGDGSLHEAVNGLMKLERDQRPALGIVPMGTANDFARSADIPLEPLEALSLAVHGEPQWVDVGCLNDVFFLNMASGGFGAKVTASTPPGLKKVLGGSAYSLVGAMRAWRFQPFDGHLIFADATQACSLIVLAIGNGRQAGGGQELTSRARINDGLLDVMAVESFHFSDIGQAVREMENLAVDGRFVRYCQTSWVRFEGERELPVNLDGEEYHFETAEFRCMASELPLILTPECPLLNDPPADSDEQSPRVLKR